MREWHAAVAGWALDDVWLRRPRVVGISGAQGAGKSTLGAAMVEAYTAQGLRALALSTDDFYLTREEQVALAAAHPGNPYLEHRGYPGTHDVALGRQTLDLLRAGAACEVPRYDKSAMGGRGDRAATGLTVEGPWDILVLEGWCLGFRPVREVEGYLEVPNQALAAYEIWHELIDALVLLRAGRPDDVVRWRVDAERARRAQGADGLSDADALDYVRRFLPAYALWLPGMLSSPPVARWLDVPLDPDREPVPGALAGLS